MAKEIELADRYVLMNKVVELHLKGENPTAIARELSMVRKDVLSYLGEFKEVARNDEGLRDRSREIVHEFDQHQNLIVKRLWETVEQVDMNSDYKTKGAILKSIADIEARRVDTLQRSGLMTDAGLADDMAEMEEKQQLLIAILKEVTANCEVCKYEVSRRLTKITGTPEPIIVQEAVPHSH